MGRTLKGPGTFTNSSVCDLNSAGKPQPTVLRGLGGVHGWGLVPGRNPFSEKLCLEAEPAHPGAVKSAAGEWLNGGRRTQCSHYQLSACWLGRGWDSTTGF